MVKLAIFDKDAITEACRIKLFLNSLPSASSDYFVEINTPTDWEETLEVWKDEVEHDVIRWQQVDLITLAVSFPFGTNGEGFLPSGNATAGLQPVWETCVVANQPMIYCGTAPPFMTVKSVWSNMGRWDHSNNHYFRTETQETLNGINDLSLIHI